MSTAEAIIDKLDLDAFFADSHHDYNLSEGTVLNQGKTRIVYLSSDIVRGIYNALEYEAGEAWRIILKNCGVMWGRRVAKHLEKEMENLFQHKPEQLTVSNYLKFLESYFRYHGWGVLELSLDDATEKGVVRATLKNSFFRSVLTEVEGFVDQMIEGMLASMFTKVSGGAELDCTQIAETDGTCQFVITAANRIEEISTMIEDGASKEDVLSKLLE